MLASSWSHGFSGLTIFNLVVPETTVQPGQHLNLGQKDSKIFEKLHFTGGFIEAATEVSKKINSGAPEKYNTVSEQTPNGPVRSPESTALRIKIAEQANAFDPADASRSPGSADLRGRPQSALILSHAKNLTPKRLA